MPEDFKVGDIFRMKGPTVPQSLEHCFWMVKAIEGESPNQTVELSIPYIDQACTQPYRKVEFLKF